jgi:acyl-CoA thioesterase
LSEKIAPQHEDTSNTMLTVTFRFDTATAVTPIAQKNGLTTFSAEVFDGWDIMGNANGGYLLAMMGRAMQQHSGRRDPFTVTAHYLAPAPAGPLEIEVDTVKTGKLVTTMNATMRRGDRNIMRVLGAWGEMAALEPQIVTATPPDLPPYEQCTSRNSDGGEFTIGLLQNVTNRLHPDDSTFISGTPSGTAQMRGWIHFPDDRPIDTLALLLAVDAMPPPLFNLPYEKGWVPTLELTVHVRAVPVGKRLACSFRTKVVQGGLLEEDGEIWDESGTLVALSRQMAVAPRAV